MAIASRTLPMKTAGTEHLIERTYREGGPLQWVRETLKNSIEAGATRVEFGVEWQAVESLGVYRRTIADNGGGMDGDQIVEFFNTFGGGGKPIGGLHENFGVGAKTSLLPWNTYGMVIISWVADEPSMIWARQDPETGEYGLRLLEVEDPETGEISLDEVYEPFADDEHGCNWAAVRPDWMGDHGTVIVLLGNSPTDDTVQGDPTRLEGDIKGISAYLNRRFWTFPVDMRVVVDEFRTQDRSQWPRSETEAGGSQPAVGPDRRTNARRILGAHHFIEYPVSFKGGKLAASDAVTLSDGTVVDWYLWEGDRPAVQSYAAISGYIAALYEGELYDVTAHHSTYRSFGISEQSIRSRLWLVIRPPLAGDESKHGVYPRTDRNSLLLRGGPNAGGPLPVNDWANEFAVAMPDRLIEEIKKARIGDGGTISDGIWRQRLTERFGSRWRIVKLRAKAGGKQTVEATQAGTRPRSIKRRKRAHAGPSGGPGVTSGTQGKLNTGSLAGTLPADQVKVGGAIPWWREVRGDELGAGMLAAWQPNDPIYRETGAVLINGDHPVLTEQVEHWQALFADVHAEDIRKEVIAAYGEIAVSKVAHSEQLKGLLPSKVVDTDLRSEAALTTALLGLIAEDSLIAPRVGGKFSKKPTA